MSALPPDGTGHPVGPEDPAPSTSNEDATASGKRKGKVKVRHTVAKVVTATLVVIALITGLTVTFLYRHYNSNLDSEDLSGAIGNQASAKEKRKWPAPSGPINVLVMGSDNRDAPGDHVDNLTGIGQRSDTTILLHISADRSRAYGVSIPRDSIVQRPSCLDNSGKPISAPAVDMWNNAFNIGGPACTIRQFFSLTHVPVNHWIVVDFAGFKSMVDALGGVTVCLPHAVVDPIGHINLPAGTHTFTGTQALDYVRERHDLGNGSDIGRMKRQQAFIASMVHKAVSADMLAKPIDMLKFLDAATKSIHLDEGIGSLAKLAGLGYQFRHVGLNKIQFVTTPWQVDPSDPNRVIWAPQAKTLWDDIRLDKPLPRSLLSGSLNAHQIPGVTKRPHNGKQEQQAAAENLANGLCA